MIASQIIASCCALACSASRCSLTCNVEDDKRAQCRVAGEEEEEEEEEKHKIPSLKEQRVHR